MDYNYGHAVGAGSREEKTTTNGAYHADEKLAPGAKAWNYIRLACGGITSEREEMDRFKAKCRAEFERRVETGEIDIYSEMQALIAPSRNKKLVGYEMEMWFGFPTNDWYRGKVISIINRKADTVKIAWDEKGLHEDDPRETIQELKETKYNPKTTKEGAWRRFFEK